MKPFLVALCVALGPTLQAGDLQEVGRVDLVDVADQWEILAPEYDYSGRSVLIRADLEDSCFENGEQALRWFLAWVARDKQDRILEAADLRGWPDRDGTCIVSLKNSSLSGQPLSGLYIYRWGLVPTEIGEPLGRGGGGGGDSYMLEPIIVDGTVTGMMNFNCSLDGGCGAEPSGLAEILPGRFDIGGNVLAVLQTKGDGFTTYRLLELEGVFKKEPAIVEFEIAARVTEVARLPIELEPLGEGATRQLVAIRGLLEQSAKANPGTVTREILRNEYLDDLLQNLEYRSTLPRDHVSDDLSPGVPR